MDKFPPLLLAINPIQNFEILYSWEPSSKTGRSDLQDKTPNGNSYIALCPDQGKTEGSRIQPQRWPAAAFEEPLAAHQAIPQQEHQPSMAGLAMLSIVFEDLCSPAKAAPILSKSNGMMQDDAADRSSISLSHCFPESEDSTPPEFVPPGYKKLLKDDLNGRIAHEMACTVKE